MGNKASLATAKKKKEGVVVYLKRVDSYLWSCCLPYMHLLGTYSNLLLFLIKCRIFWGLAFC